LEDRDITDLLIRLVGKSLVIYEESAGGRYRLLETVRQYGRERLRESGGADRVRTQHRDWFLRLAEQRGSSQQSSATAGWIDAVEPEHDNFRAALDWCLEDPTGAETGLRLAVALAEFWRARYSYEAEGLQWLMALLGRNGEPEPTALRAAALHWAGVFARLQSQYEVASALLERSLAIRRELGDKHGIAETVGWLGGAIRLQGDYSRARPYLAESLTLWRELGDRIEVAHLTASLGNVAREEGDTVAARALYTESLVLGQELGNRGRVAHSLVHLGDLACDESDYASAEAFYAESLAIYRELGVLWGIAACLGQLSRASCGQGRHALARAQVKESLEMYRQMEAKGPDMIGALESVGQVACCQGEVEEAARLLGAAAAEREALGITPLPHERAFLEPTLEEVRAALGEAAFATAWAAGRAMPLEAAVCVALEECEIPTTGRKGS
jgi:tetratricopeptide (TPR) repeat protein